MKNVILLFLFFFVIQTGSSQINADKLVYTKGKYYYKNRIYKKEAADKLFILNDKAYESYKIVRKANKIGNITALSSIVMVGGGWLLIENDGCDQDLCGSGTIGLFSFLLGIPVGAASIVSYTVARINFNRSKNIFNENIKNSNKMGAMPIEINIGSTDNGVGLVLNF